MYHEVVDSIKAFLKHGSPIDDFIKMCQQKVFLNLTIRTGKNGVFFNSVK